MKRGLFLLSTVFVALALVPAATANPPERRAIDSDILIPDQCAFPVLGHIEGGEINRDFFDKAGNLVKQLGVFPGQTSTWTNLETGKSITVSDAGSFHVRFEPDGSGTAVFNGHGPIPNFITGQHGMWYLDGGQITATGDADGNLTSLVVRGNLVDLCTRLAP
jgi:hypothetical protein